MCCAPVCTSTCKLDVYFLHVNLTSKLSSAEPCGEGLSISVSIAAMVFVNSIHAKLEAENILNNI
jgi:hypothetical protein